MVEIRELINKYFTGTIEKEEKEKLLDLLDSNPEMKKEFEFEKQVQRTLNENEFARLKRTLIESESVKDTSESKNPKQLSNQFLRIAASILFLVSIGTAFYFFNPSSGLNSDKLVAEYYDSYPNDYFMAERSADQSKNEVKEAFLLYDGKQYDKAAESFKELKQKKDNAAINLYLALSQLEIGETINAIKNLESIKDQRDTTYLEVKNWYLALAYLKNDQIFEAKSLLIQMKTSDQRYRKTQLNELLSELE